jgi:hypothetical protein
MQEHVKPWDQIDIVLMEVPTSNLYELQQHITEELRLRAHAKDDLFQRLSEQHAELQVEHAKTSAKHEELLKAP